MSTLRVNAIVDASGGNTATVNTYAPPAPMRAWVNFNGTGTPAIRASLNVSSITDNGAGNYTLNFTTAISDVNFIALYTTANGYVPWIGSKTTTSVQILNWYGGTYSDQTENNVAVFR